MNIAYGRTDGMTDSAMSLYVPFFFSKRAHKKVAKISNRYNQVSHLTQDTPWESDENTKRAKRSAFSQQATTEQQ